MRPTSTAVWGCAAKDCSWFGPFEDVRHVGANWACPRCGTKAIYLSLEAGPPEGIRANYQKSLTKHEIAIAGSPASRSAEALEQKEQEDDEQRAA